MSLLPIPLNRVAADPTITSNPDGTSTAVWNFTTPADYALSNTAISGGVASLASQTTWWNSTTAADFAGPDSEVNIDRATWPGDVALATTSGPMTLLTLQPAATGEDTYLDRNNPTTNHGADTTILLDGRNPQDWPLLRFDLSTVPAGVGIDDAVFSMYESTGVGNPVTANVHQVTAQWVESQATWTERNTGTPWAAAGGDYGAHTVDVLNVDNTAGWKAWNVTNLVDLWYRGRIPNYGFIITAPNPGAVSTKTFFSSDYNVDPTRRPKLDIRYRILGSAGAYVSKTGGPGTTAQWQTISWNGTERSLASDEFPGPALDPKWSWTNPPPSYDVGTTTPGSLHVVSSTGVDFNGATFTGNMLSNDVVGDFTATMKFSSNPTVNGQKAGLIVWDRNRDWYSVAKTNVAGSVNWRVRSTVDAATTVRVDLASGNPIPAWVRIQRVGTTFTAYTSPDGTTWTLRDTYTPTFEYPLSIRLGLIFADGLSGTAHTVDVDYVRVTFGTDATVSVSTRTGDVTPVDGTWSGWSAAYPTPSGSAMAGNSRYIEYRLSFAVVYPDHNPVVGDANISWFRYQPAGTVETNDLVPTDLKAWGPLTTVDALNGQTIAYAYSLNSGGSWTPVSPPADLSAASTATGKIRFRASLSTSNTLVTPTLSEIRLTYTHTLDHFYVTASAAATAGSPFSVTVTAKDALNATVTSWTGTVALAARLLDGVTPGGGVLGTTSLAISSGGTATLATETYTKAETIRILASFVPTTGLSGGVVVSPGPVNRILISPDNVTLLPFDARVFTAVAFDVYNNTVPGAVFSWVVGGGVGTLNSSSGASVRFTASPPPANGTLQVSSGPQSATAQVHVVWGVPPWVAIGSPSPGAHVMGIVPITYTNSSDAVSLEFDYDRGTGWTLIGTTVALSGTYLWDTGGLDFTGGSLRAIVTNNRTMTNATVVTPIEVDNTPPTISITSVTDDQAGSGTLAIAYATSADVVRVDFTYFDGAWKGIGPDVTIDGSYVWTPGVRINGVTLRAVAADDVSLTGVDQRQGVGRYVVGSGPPSIAPIPDVHVHVGSTYRLNLTFYVTDPDTSLSSLAISVSDAANVSANSGPYPFLDITYGAAGAYLVTLWVSDGTDTAWTIVRVIASAQNPPRLVAALPGVTFDEDTTALNALGSPATAFFMDPDGDPMTFTVLDGRNVLSRVNGNDTIDLWATPNWYGSESLRLRATDPSGGFAEAAFRVVVRPVNDAPGLATPFPAVFFDEDTVATNVFGGNATLHFLDVDGDPLTLTVLGAVVLGVRVNPDGMIDLWAPANWSGSETLRVRATDPNGTFAEGMFTATVRPVNDAPVVVAPVPDVTYDEDTTATDVFGGPASTHFFDRDVDVLTFTVIGASQVRSRVNANGTVDLWAAPNWYGSENLRLRATDPNGSFAEAPFRAVVRPVNDPPVLAPVPDLRIDEGATVTLDLDPYISDIDTNLSSITVTTDSPYVSVTGHVLTIAYPANQTEATFTITISDGQATASGPVRATFVPSWWKAPYVLAMPPVGILAVVAVFARRAMFRPAKAFLVDERNRMLREFTLDPSCGVTYDEAVQAGALDAVEKPVKVQKYHAQTVRGDALAVVLLAYGPVNAEQIEFARELLVNIQDKFEDSVKTRLEAVRGAEADLEAPRRALQEGQEALAARSRAFASVMDASIAAQARVAAESAKIQARLSEVEMREAGLREAQGRIERESEELHGLRESLGAREREASERETVLSNRAKTLQMRESQIAPLEAELSERESTVAVRETQMQEQSQTITQRAVELSRSRKDLEEREAKLARERDVLEKARADLDPQVAAFEARVAKFETESQRTREDLESRAAAVESERQSVSTERDEFEAMRSEKSLSLTRKESELNEWDEGLKARESALQAQSRLVTDKETDLTSKAGALDEREAILTRDTIALTGARAAFEPERKSLDERVARFEEEFRRRKADLDAQAKSLGEEQLKFASEKQAFETMRTERSQWISTKEIELEAREQGLQEKEKAVRTQAEENARNLADLAAREEALEIEGDKVEKGRAEVASRLADLERLGKSLEAKTSDLREWEAKKAEELRAWEATMGSQQALLRQQREAFDKESTERKEQWAMRQIHLEEKEEELAEREAKVRSDLETVTRADEDLKQRESDLTQSQKSATDALAKAAVAEKSIQEQAFELDRRDRMLREEAAKITDDLAHRGAALKAAQSDYEAKRLQHEEAAAAHRQQVQTAESDLAALSRSLDARAKELTDREGRAETLDASLREQEERIVREAQDNAAATRQIQARQVELEQVAQRNTTETERIRAEADATHKSFAARDAELRSERERLERESNALQDRLGAKAQELAAREKALAARESEFAEGGQRFATERGAWAEAHKREMKQLETTQQAVAEQSQRAEKQFEDAQRRTYLASEAEKSAKRQMDELAAQRAQLEERRGTAERAERAAEAQTAQLNEATRRLAAKEIELTALTKDLKEREAKIGVIAMEASRASEEVKSRKATLDQESARLENARKEVQARGAVLDERASTLEGKAAELVQRERVLTTELQRSENLMEDLNRKQTELQSREQSLNAAKTDLAVWDDEVAKKEVELKAAMASTDGVRSDLQNRVAEAERDRETASKAREEGLAVKAEAERARAQGEAMQAEVQKSTKFLQKKAVETLDREEKARKRELALEEKETAFEARAEILDAKEKTLDVDREEFTMKIERLQADVRRLKEKLSEAEKNAGTSAEMEEWKRDLDARVKIVQKKAFDLLDREEQLRKKEEELKALAQRLGVQM